MRPVLAIAFAFVALAARAAPSSTAEIIDRELAASGVPGMAYAVVHDGRTIEIGARGTKHADRPEGVTADTTFQIGSISKSFTALAVMQLAETGAIELDAPIARYLDAFAGKPAGAITVRQLLSHTSGYSTLQGNRSQTDFSTDAAAIGRRVSGLLDVRPKYAPASVWEYSNANYQIVGRLIEAVSGLDYATYIERRVLAPAGMTDSFVHGTRVSANTAAGHRPWFGAKVPLGRNMTGRNAEGGVVSTARDMALWLGMMMNGKDDILSAGGKRLMMTRASAISPDYGLGWTIDRKRALVFHGGSNPGFPGAGDHAPE